jgi:hypothetical protein
LKKLLSVGDYKETDPVKLQTAYQKAFEGLKNSSEYINLQVLFSRQLESLSMGIDLLMFASINFPTKKVKSIARSLTVSTETTNKLLKGREGTSVKQLKSQIQKNYMIGDLFKFAYALLKDCQEFPRSLSILEELSNLSI